MKDIVVNRKNSLLPIMINVHQTHWLVIGATEQAIESINNLLHCNGNFSIKVIAPAITEDLKSLAQTHHRVKLQEKEWDSNDLIGVDFLIAASGDSILDEKISSEAKLQNIWVSRTTNNDFSDFVVSQKPAAQAHTNGHTVQKNGEGRIIKGTDQKWQKIASRLVLAFFLMVLGHIIISYLPLPPIKEILVDAKPYFDRNFLFFVLAGFLAQMVDGVLSMGYGVTSATCLISFGVNPVAMSAAIHTSEIFTSGISGYSHYKFGNVNKKLFKHLVIPGVIGAILGAALLVYLGEQGGKWLMPIMALYAGFLGLKILFKAFQQQTRTKKVKRVGWLAWVGGFLDSFGGGGWGPIVTSTLIAKGKSPKYIVGSVSLTEFFITLASAFTFFVSVGVSHWNIVLGLLIGGTVAAPIAARLAGKLPRKTMMIAVGIMVMVWCVRMIVKSLF